MRLKDLLEDCLSVVCLSFHSLDNGQGGRGEGYGCPGREAAAGVFQAARCPEIRESVTLLVT